MRTLLSLSLFVSLGFLAACGSNRNPDGPTKTIVVSPYSSLSDSELNQQYLALLLQLQELNEEMDVANKARDFDEVHTKAQVGLEKARTARRIAGHFDDDSIREKRLGAIDNIISDLDKLVEITR